MDMSFEEKVRERAYQIWMSAGMGDGMAHEHWLTAESAVRNETSAPSLKGAKRVAKASTEKAPTVKSAKAAPKAPTAKKAPAKKKADTVKH